MKYTGSNSKWNCLEIPYDGSGHEVWIRYGQSRQFGYLHAYLDHNADLTTMVDVVAGSANGIEQPNGRFLYGAVYRVRGEPIEFFNLYEQRSAGAGSPDKHDLGVVTAYCTGSYDGGEPKTKCRDWVNQTL